MLSRVFSFIMAIIVTLFPFLWKPGKSTISNETVANAVISSVENKDASAMEKVMCKNIKDNYEDLTGEIDKMLSLIEGDIESITYGTGGNYSQSDGNGKYIAQNFQDYQIITTRGAYGFTVVVETKNSFAPDELGIRAISLHTKIKNTDPSINREYVYGEFICDIAASEGVRDWHD